MAVAPPAGWAEAQRDAIQTLASNAGVESDSDADTPRRRWPSISLHRWACANSV
ncbi:hypothetical protein PMI04_020725 [Sphingobium sp. AP49]|uniref:hypothetical protein n=1 Tax=Sphingobium sp. AP49 TaxID=1144307 RepID=UPI0003124911|nr:hypothetical protein [Sphingobium sp. AP49]WHO38924.1 hypothetical protein PMI04_020725 [Sphingobium sp. AP49]